MAAGVGSIIEPLDYNSIQTVIASVMGVSSGNSGYGQAISSSQVSSGAIISVAQMAALRSDLARARVHQTNTAVADGLAITPGNIGTPWQTLQAVTNSTTILEKIRDQYSQFATGAQANEGLAANGQLTAGVAVTSQSRDCNVNTWGGTSQVQTISYTATVTFNGYTQGSLVVSAADHARCFFNAGGKITFFGSNSGWPADTSAAKSQDWANMLSGFGTFTFSAASSSISGSVNAGGSVATTTGFRSLAIGGGAATLMVQTSSVSVYNQNTYTVTVSRPTASTLSFVFTYYDGNPVIYVAPAPGSTPGTGGYTVDETVKGLIVNTVTCTRPSGSNVDVPAPTGSSSAL